jgi:hypothetical protein
MGRSRALRDPQLRNDRDHLLIGTRIKLVIVVVVGGAVAAWLVAHDVRSEGTARPLPWRDLTAQTGQLTLPRAITREFISRAQLAAYLRSRGGRRVPRIAFPRWRAVLITIGPRSSTAYSIRVLRVAEEERRVVVTVLRRDATLAHPGRPKLTSPYQLITLPTTGKPIHLEVVGRARRQSSSAAAN